eukprot:11089-Pelagomonas_calceolata.AAC.10
MGSHTQGPGSPHANRVPLLGARCTVAAARFGAVGWNQCTVAAAKSTMVAARYGAVRRSQMDMAAAGYKVAQCTVVQSTVVESQDAYTESCYKVAAAQWWSVQWLLQGGTVHGGYCKVAAARCTVAAARGGPHIVDCSPNFSGPAGACRAQCFVAGQSSSTSFGKERARRAHLFYAAVSLYAPVPRTILINSFWQSDLCLAVREQYMLSCRNGAGGFRPTTSTTAGSRLPTACVVFLFFLSCGKGVCSSCEALIEASMCFHKRIQNNNRGNNKKKKTRTSKQGSWTQGQHPAAAARSLWEPRNVNHQHVRKG